MNALSLPSLCSEAACQTALLKQRVSTTSTKLTELCNKITTCSHRIASCLHKYMYCNSCHEVVLKYVHFNSYHEVVMKYVHYNSCQKVVYVGDLRRCMIVAID